MRSGVMIPPLREATQDGYDLQFGTNVVAHFYFTELLMPALLAGVASSPDRHARIVTTTSSSAYLGKLRYDTFKDGPARLKSSRDALYTQSKLVRVSLPLWWAHKPYSQPSTLGKYYRRARDCKALCGEGHCLLLGQPRYTVPSSWISFACCSAHRRPCQLSPGNIQTELQRHVPGLVRKLLVRRSAP